MATSKLTKYKLIGEGAQLLEASTESAPKYLVILQNAQTGDPHFSVKINQLTDYHAEMILARKDGKGQRYVKPLSDLKKATPPPNPKEGKGS